MNSDKTLYDWLQEISQVWDMDPAKLAQVLHVSQERVRSWIECPLTERSPATIPRGMETVAPLVHIYQMLGRKFQGDLEEAAQWLFQGHQDFGGETPIRVMMSSSENLAWVAYYLESESQKRL
jgi:hypothetical protein